MPLASTASSAFPSATPSPSSAAASPSSAAADHAQLLRRHVADCRSARSRWSGAAALAQRVHGRLMPRFVTLVGGASLLLALGLLLAARWG